MLKTTGVAPKQLQDVPSPPEDMLYLAGWHKEIRDGEVITYQKLHYWQLVMKRQLAGWEAEVLLAIDRLYWTIQAGSTNNDH